MRISDWSSDVCSTELPGPAPAGIGQPHRRPCDRPRRRGDLRVDRLPRRHRGGLRADPRGRVGPGVQRGLLRRLQPRADQPRRPRAPAGDHPQGRSEEHTSELQSLMRISYAVFCLKKKNKIILTHTTLLKYNKKHSKKTNHTNYFYKQQLTINHLYT